MLCPDLIGRDDEIEHLLARVASLPARRGGVVAVVGEAGVGKSRVTDRLIELLSSDTDVVVLTGRAVPAANPTPYRALIEALLGATRGRSVPADPSLVGFEGHLGRLVPSWSTGAVADDSPVLLGEAVVRLLTVLAGDAAVVLLLEDVHWADPETTAVIEYLADALRDQPVLCVCTSRPDATIVDALVRLDRRDAGDIIRIEPLDELEVDRMVASCLAIDLPPPAGLGDFVQAHSDGNPFLVEELLAGLVAAGALHRTGDRWATTGPLTPAVPASLRGSIRRRVAELDPTTRRVLAGASLLGRLFEWDLLPGIADVDGRAAVDALRAAVDAQLIEVDGTGFRFRHALTREAILEDVLPPERRELAGRAWPAIERAHPGLPGSFCQLAADLAEASGDAPAAATRLVECARRALADGALATAEATARRAGELAIGDGVVADDADEVLVHVLAAAGKANDALAVGHELARRLADANAPSERRADLLVALVRAAVAAGDLDAAGRAAVDARSAAGDDAGPALLARIDTVEAEVALDRADLEVAERLSRRSIERALATDQDAVRCEALLILGRVVRPNRPGLAVECFREAAALAEAAGLAPWHLRARQELALDAFDTEGTEPLRATRDLAARYGAHLTVAAMDLMLADAALSAFDHEAGRQAATRCIDACRRYGLAAEPVAQLWLAGAHAVAGDDPAMQAAIDAALARDADDPRILGDLYGRVLTTRAFVQDELDTLGGLVDRMVGHVRRAPPTTSIYPGRVLWAILHTIDDDDLGDAARAEYAEATGPYGLPLFERYGTVLEAVARGRRGDAAGAGALLAPTYAEIVASPAAAGLVHATSLVVARAAIRDGWGEPVRWIRDSEAWFAERRFDALVRRCRALLGEAGAPVPRRGRGESAVPESLRALGVTSREVDVLKLVVAGRTTKEIAAELYLSPKTVERHLTSLFDRTGVRNRRALAEVGVTHLA